MQTISKKAGFEKYKTLLNLHNLKNTYPNKYIL